MADLCVFCGKKLPRFMQKELLCCGILQPVCGDCYPEIAELPQEERGRRALNSGRAVEPEIIRTFLEQRQIDMEKARQSKMTDKLCPRCVPASSMLRMGKHKFQLGQETFFGGDWEHFMAGALELEMLQCETCGLVEFYGAVEPKMEVPLVTCPKCGAQHEASQKCPRCAMNQASGQSTLKIPKEKTEKKPPWER